MDSATNLAPKREIARQLLTELFGFRSRILIADAVEAGAAVEVSYRTLQRAAKDLGVKQIHNGQHPAFWELPT